MTAGLPRLLFTAPASGGGKTTVTTGLLQLFRNRGLTPAAFKCGPDYIDPMFHREVQGTDGYSLDLFFAGADTVRGLLCRGSAGADITLLEGVMGYYDGIGGTDEASTWRTASETQTPAVMVLRPAGSFLSLAAAVRGFQLFRPDSQLRGLLLNACSESFYRKARPMLERETGLPVYGYLPKMPEAVIESRHLGLLTPDAVAGLRQKISLLAEAMEETLDADGLLALAASAPPCSGRDPFPVFSAGVRTRIAVARDAAFCFYYRENLELLEACGAELVPFSPLADAALPSGIGGLYLGGGYPELHAGQLAANASMRESVRSAVRAGMPCLAECGGFLYLQKRLEDENGRAHDMAGALAGIGRNSGSLRRFGYVTLSSAKETLLTEPGQELRAHEFHYWDSTGSGSSCQAVRADGSQSWPCVTADGALFAGFPHLYLLSSPASAARFVSAAAAWSGA